MKPAASSATTPRLSGIVVQWRNDEALAELVEAWPLQDDRFELLVVDNGSHDALRLPEPVRLLEPGRNLGFAGGVNLGARDARGEILLILNPDVRPEPGALEALLAGFDALGDAIGLAPRLLGLDGGCQTSWQLRALPQRRHLLLQILFVPDRLGVTSEPTAGAVVDQPAAAALAVRREALDRLGGFDRDYYPAWFEDVDFAQRVRDSGRLLRYWPSSVFRHRLGGSVPELGFGPFLWVYYRNLIRFAERHFGPLFGQTLRALVPCSALARLLFLPLRRPRRAASRREAAAALFDLALGGLSGFERPRRLATTFALPEQEEEART